MPNILNLLNPFYMSTPTPPAADSFEAAVARQDELVNDAINSKKAGGDKVHGAISRMQNSAHNLFASQPTMSQYKATPVVIDPNSNIVVRGVKKFENFRQNTSEKISTSIGAAAQKAGERTHTVVFNKLNGLVKAGELGNVRAFTRVIQNVVAFTAAFVVRFSILTAGYAARLALLLPYIITAVAAVALAAVAAKYIAIGFAAAAAAYGVTKVVALSYAIGSTLTTAVLAGAVIKLYNMFKGTQTPAQTPSFTDRVKALFGAAKNLVVNHLPNMPKKVNKTAIVAGVVGFGALYTAYQYGAFGALASFFAPKGIVSNPELVIPQQFGPVNVFEACANAPIASKCVAGFTAVAKKAVQTVPAVLAAVAEKAVQTVPAVLANVSKTGTALIARDFCIA